MLKTLIISSAISGLLLSGALAQSTPPPASPKATEHAAETKSPKFIQAQGTDRLVFSRFKGTEVLGPDNTKVGSVNDLLFDKNGKIDGLIVGVGGFLGIGEKNVAIAMTAFDMVPYQAAAVPSTTGSANTAMPAENDPTHVSLKVSWTKDELKAASDFQYYRPPVRTSQRPGAPLTNGIGGPAAPAPTLPRH